MAETVLGYRDQVFIVVTIGNITLDLSEDSILSFMMTETLNMFMPTAQLVIKDIEHKITEVLGLSPIDTVLIKIGNNYEDMKEYAFDIFSIREGQVAEQANPTSTIITLSLILKNGWKDLFQVQKIRGWNSSASTVVSQIADECVFNKRIESSIDQRNYIQANWTNAQMIRHLASYAKNKYGDTGYIYAVTRDSDFVFGSYRSLYETTAVQDLEFSTIDDETFSDKTVHRVNKILNHSYNSNARLFMVNGSYGQKTSGFSLSQNKYILTDETIRSTEYKSISKHLFLSDADIRATRAHHMYNYENSKDIVDGKIITAIANLFNFEVVLLYNQKINLGNVLSVKVPAVVRKTVAGVEKRNIEVLEYLSGNYLVSRVTHYYTVNAKVHLTKIGLIRDGMDHKLKTGLAKI